MREPNAVETPFLPVLIFCSDLRAQKLTGMRSITRTARYRPLFTILDRPLLVFCRCLKSSDVAHLTSRVRRGANGRVVFTHEYLRVFICVSSDLSNSPAEQQVGLLW